MQHPFCTYSVLERYFISFLCTLQSMTRCHEASGERNITETVAELLLQEKCSEDCILLQGSRSTFTHEELMQGLIFFLGRRKGS